MKVKHFGTTSYDNKIKSLEFQFWGKKCEIKCVADRTESEFYCMLEKPKVLSIHLFSKILNPAYLYLNTIGIFWRKFDSKMFKNDRGG